MQDAIPDAAYDNSPLSNGSVPILIDDFDRAADIMLYLHSASLRTFVCLLDSIGEYLFGMQR